MDLDDSQEIQKERQLRALMKSLKRRLLERESAFLEEQTEKILNDPRLHALETFLLGRVGKIWTRSETRELDSIMYELKRGALSRVEQLYFHDWKPTRHEREAGLQSTLREFKRWVAASEDRPWTSKESSRVLFHRDVLESYLKLRKAEPERMSGVNRAATIIVLLITSVPAAFWSYLSDGNIVKALIGGWIVFYFTRELLDVGDHIFRARRELDHVLLRVAEIYSRLPSDDQDLK